MTNQTSDKRRKGIYLLPNLFTTAALFAGFYAIIAAIQGAFETAAIAVVVAGVLDGLDGRIARLTNTQSEFGVQYDSMSDLVSFGVAPSLVMYLWSLQWLREWGNVWGKMGWLAAFLYAACGALRLARFNTQVGVADKRYFQGLASPASAGIMVTSVWLAEINGISGRDVMPIMLLLTAGCALLMVSNIRYFSFKSLGIAEKVPFFKTLILLLLFVLLTIKPAVVLFSFGLIYLVSGPFITIVGRIRLRLKRKHLPVEPVDQKESPLGDDHDA